MAVIITDNRTVVDEADTTTGWTSSNGLAVFTAAPDPVESAGSLGQQVSNATEEASHTLAASDNLTDTLVYCWLLPGGVLDTTVNGGVQVIIGDGTNRIGYHVGGSDSAGFRHDSGPVTWQCFVIDTGSLPANNTAFAGAPGSLNAAAITDVGNAFKTLAKSVGGVANCFMDIAFYGNGGLTITGGGVGTEGKFLEIAQRDRSTADHPGSGVASAVGGGYGVIRELGADLFGLQSRLVFGDSAGTDSLNFEDLGQTIVFEDRGIATNKYGYTITGNGTGATSFILGNRDSATSGSNGCSLIAPSGVGAFFTATSTNINLFGLYGCTLSGFSQGVSFTTNLTAGANFEVFSTNFVGCSQISIGEIFFINNSIQGSLATGTAEGAVLISNTSRVSDLSFTSGGTGHAIEIADATNSPFSFVNFTYSGYAATDGGTGNEVIVNTSGSPITINVTGGDTPTVDTTNSTGSVTIVNNVSVVIEVIDTATNPVENAVVAAYDLGTNTQLTNDLTDVNGLVSFTDIANNDIYIRVRKSSSGSTRYEPIETVANTGPNGLSLSITLIEDEFASA